MYLLRHNAVGFATKPGLASAQEPSDAAAPEAASAALALRGLVLDRTPLGAQDLRQSPLAHELAAIDLRTRTGEVKRTLTGYRGILLTDLLDRARIQAAGHNELKRSYVVARAKDGYTVVFSWIELYNTEVGPGAYVLVEKDGAAIADSEGPLTLISARDLNTGPRHVRWLTSLEVQRV